MRTSESIKELSKAMAAFHGDIGLIIKNGKGNYGTYANVHGVIESISPILSKHGLSVRQFVDILTLSDGRLQQVLVTRISHLSGEFEEGVCILDPQEKGAQKLGSYLTYMRRYCLISAFSLAVGEDDDAQSDQDAADEKARQQKLATAPRTLDPSYQPPKPAAYTQASSFPPPGTKESPSEKLTQDEKKFMEQWVASYPDQAEEVLKRYKNHKGYSTTPGFVWSMDRGEFYRFKKEMGL